MEIYNIRLNSAMHLIANLFKEQRRPITFFELEEAMRKDGYDGSYGKVDLYWDNNPNIVFWKGIDLHIGEALLKMCVAGEIQFEAISEAIYTMNGVVVDLPTAKPKNIKKYQLLRWLPTVITPTPKLANKL